jgi:hypothetical protein
MGENRNLLWVMIVLLIAVFLLLLLVAFMFILRPDQSPDDMIPTEDIALIVAQTLAAGETQVAEQVTATPIPSEPTPTQITPEPTVEPPSPSATQEPTPTSTPIPGDPAEILGDPDGLDTFDNANNWELFDDRCFKSEITGGKYEMTAKGLPGVACWEVTWAKMLDYYTQVIIEMPETCRDDDRFGLFFRTPDIQVGYLYGLTCDGRYIMTKWDGETTEVLANFATSEYINVGPGQVNRLGVIADGARYYLYVNGVLLKEVEDESYIDDGKIGFYIRASSEDSFMVRFDDLAVWLLDEEE